MESALSLAGSPHPWFLDTDWPLGFWISTALLRPSTPPAGFPSKAESFQDDPLLDLWEKHRCYCHAIDGNKTRIPVKPSFSVLLSTKPMVPHI